MRRRLEQGNDRLPIKLDSTSNGEFVPVPLEPIHERANRLAHERATENARRAGMERRAFLASACGAISTLLAFNEVFAESGTGGGFYAAPADAAVDPELARSELGGIDLIFDVQGHFVNPTGAWLESVPAGVRPLTDPTFFPKTQCLPQADPASLDYLECIGPDAFIKDVFLDSDTDLMVLTYMPSHRDQEPLTIEEAKAVSDIVRSIDGAHRLFLHGRVNPNQKGDIEDMERLASEFAVVAWKTYTQWGPDGHGFWLTDEVGIEFIEMARKLGVKTICVHKGIPFGDQKEYKYSLCDDIGPVAKRFPDVKFIVYHSGWEMQTRERAYDPRGKRSGVDSLIRSVLAAGLGPGSNVYADLGSTWRFLMRDPEQAAHLLGKLLKYIGEDNVLWGTDSIWYGSPQDQIQRLRTFTLAPSFRDRFEYPELTLEVKKKIFGLNAARVYGLDLNDTRRLLKRDAVARARDNYLNHPSPHFRTYGPKTRREFLNLLKWSGRQSG